MIERADNTAMAIVELPPNKPASWGNQAISDLGSFGPGAMLIIDFSEPVSVGAISSATMAVTTTAQLSSPRIQG